MRGMTKAFYALAAGLHGVLNPIYDFGAWSILDWIQCVPEQSTTILTLH
jgi:hypothetical protein